MCNLNQNINEANQAIGEVIRHKTLALLLPVGQINSVEELQTHISTHMLELMMQPIPRVRDPKIPDWLMKRFEVAASKALNKAVEAGVLVRREPK